jgi:hypothetical protein
VLVGNDRGLSLLLEGNRRLLFWVPVANRRLLSLLLVGIRFPLFLKNNADGGLLRGLGPRRRPSVLRRSLSRRNPRSLLREATLIGALTGTGGGGSGSCAASAAVTLRPVTSFIIGRTGRGARVCLTAPRIVTTAVATIARLIVTALIACRASSLQGHTPLAVWVDAGDVARSGAHSLCSC